MWLYLKQDLCTGQRGDSHDNCCAKKQLHSGWIRLKVVAFQGRSLPQVPVVVVVRVCNLNGICGPGERQTKTKPRSKKKKQRQTAQMFMAWSRSSWAIPPCPKSNQQKQIKCTKHKRHINIKINRKPHACFTKRVEAMITSTLTLTSDISLLYEFITRGICIYTIATSI